MIKENIAYKQLKMRRDVVKFIYDMRCFEVIASTNDKEDKLRHNNWMEYLNRFEPWEEKLRRFISGAKEGLVNLNVLDEYGDGLKTKLRELEKNASDEEQSEVAEMRRIQAEINYLESCCPHLETLVAELIKFSRMSLPAQPIESGQLDAIIEEMITLLAYDPMSAEYKILMNETTNPRWFSAYFLDKDEISIEEHQKNMNTLLRKMSEDGGQYRLSVLDYALPIYLGKSLIVEEGVLTRLIECNKFRIKDVASEALVIMRSKNATLPFDADDYLASRIEEFKHPKENPIYLKGSSSPIYLKDHTPEPLTPREVAEQLKTIIEPFLCLCESHGFMTTLANRISTLDGHLEIASIISNYLKTEFSTPKFARMFDSAYLRVQDELAVSRSRLVFTLKEIKKQK